MLPKVDEEEIRRVGSSSDKTVQSALLPSWLLRCTHICASWWSQVCGNPNIDNTLLMFTGLTSSQNPKFRLPVRTDDANQTPETSHESSTDFLRAVLEAERMIARFGLLSWTLCFNTMSPIFRKKFGTFDSLKKKGLLNEREETALKVGIKFCHNYLLPGHFKQSEWPNLFRIMGNSSCMVCHPHQGDWAKRRDIRAGWKGEGEPADHLKGPQRIA